MKGVVCTRDDARQQLAVLAKEGVTATRERTEGDLLTGVRFAIKVAEGILAEHRLAALPERSVL